VLPPRTIERSLKVGSTPRVSSYEYVIVGGGSSGCVLANRLSEDPSVRVCLLEAGPVDRNALLHIPMGAVAFLPWRNRHNWAFQTTPQPGLNGRRGYQPRGRTLGGSSAINAMCYIRGHRRDYDEWAAQGASGWSFDEVLPYFKKSEHQTRGADAFHGVGGPMYVSDLRSPNPFVDRFVRAANEVGYPTTPDFNGAQQEGVGPYQVTQIEGERCSAARAYLHPIRARANLDVRTDSHVTRVLFEGRRAVGVEVRRDGRIETIHASREVILAAGALQSPQILMLSGVGPGAHLREHGIDVVHDLRGVGENLHDHIDYTTGYRANASQATELLGVSLRGAVRLVQAWRRYRAERRGDLTSNFAEAGAFLKSDSSEPIPDLQLFFVVAMVDDHARKPHWGHGFSCHVCLLRPKSRGRLSLANNDPYSAPLIDPNFLGDSRDLETLVRGFKIVRRILRAPALAPYRGVELYTGNVESDDAIRAAIRARADTVYHPVGTCRMGSDEHSVLDPQLRVRGVERLRVVDCSVMPSIIGGNTNAPAIMIGEKAADMIRASQAGWLVVNRIAA
jgi:choline dehydrogenase-like flavoprotein